MDVVGMEMESGNDGEWIEDSGEKQWASSAAISFLSFCPPSLLSSTPKTASDHLFRFLSLVHRCSRALDAYSLCFGGIE